MQEPNETMQTKLTPKEVCSMRIVFPVTSDEQAIEYKKKITALLSEIPEAAIQFSIMSGRPSMPSMSNVPV